MPIGDCGKITIETAVAHVISWTVFYWGVGGRVIMLSIGECSVGERSWVSPLSVRTIASKIIPSGFSNSDPLVDGKKAITKRCCSTRKGSRERIEHGGRRPYGFLDEGLRWSWAIPYRRTGLKTFEDQAIGPARMCPKLAMDGECSGPTSMLRPKLAFGTSISRVSCASNQTICMNDLNTSKHQDITLLFRTLFEFDSSSRMFPSINPGFFLGSVLFDFWIDHQKPLFFCQGCSWRSRVGSCSRCHWRSCLSWCLPAALPLGAFLVSLGQERRGVNRVLWTHGVKFHILDYFVASRSVI